MARRTAMNKEPGKVSIAVPDYEKRRLGPQQSYLPGPIQNMPEPMPKEQLKRVSPGVYRNSLGELVGSRGQSLGNRDGRPGDAIRNALGDMTNPGARTPAARPGQQALPVEMPQRWLPEWQRLQQSPGNMAEQIIGQPIEPNPNFQGIVRDAAGQLAQDNSVNQIGQNIANMPPPAPRPGMQIGADIGSQIQPGYLPNMQPPFQDLSLRYPPGQAPTMEQLQQAFQPVTRQQPNTVANLLRRGR